MHTAILTKVNKIMSDNAATQQNLCLRFATVLRRLELEGGSIHKLADALGEDARDLRRWADGTKMPGHITLALLGELPRHLADYLLAPTGLRLVAQGDTGEANAMLAAMACNKLAGSIAERMLDGTFCHQDKAATADDARRTIAELQALAGE